MTIEYLLLQTIPQPPGFGEHENVTVVLFMGSLKVTTMVAFKSISIELYGCDVNIIVPEVIVLIVL